MISKLLLLPGGPGISGYMDTLPIEGSYRMEEIVPSELTITREIEKISKECDGNTVLVGHSFGTVLAILTASTYPELVKGIVLVGLAPLSLESLKNFMQTVNDRLGPDLLENFNALHEQFHTQNSQEAGLQIVKLLTEHAYTLPQKATYNKVLYPKRADGLLHMALTTSYASFLSNDEYFPEFLKKIKCPIILHQGIYDPNPSLKAFKSIAIHVNSPMVLTEHIGGHIPWIEESSADNFRVQLNRDLDFLNLYEG